MKILALDPGNVRTAYVAYDTETHRVTSKDLADNETIKQVVADGRGCDLCAIEMVACYGMAVGATVFDTARWVGRFQEAWRGSTPAVLVYRREVKLAVCGQCKAKDSNIRAALMDLFPATGGGKTPAVGTKAQPGPLYGFKADLWAALGVAVTFADSIGARPLYGRERRAV